MPPVLEIGIIILITLLFIYYERPNLFFLFLGYFFYCIALIFQIPIKILEGYFLEQVSLIVLPLIIGIIISVTITQTLKYFSLKRFMITKSYKNGILFAIAWASLEAIPQFSNFFYEKLFSYLEITMPLSLLPVSEIDIITFIFLFTLNLGVSVLIVMGVIKKRLRYLVYAIFFASISIIGVNILEENSKLIFASLITFYSLFLMLRYKFLK